MAYIKYTCENRHLFDKPVAGDNFTLLCPYCESKAKKRDGKYQTNFIMRTKPGEQNIIDSSPMAHVNDGLPDDL